LVKKIIDLVAWDVCKNTLVEKAEFLGIIVIQFSKITFSVFISVGGWMVLL